jgi:glycosyltransferase involved in cell wall biosynthesis
MSKPLVSIIIPCYNAERWLGETLESIRAQDYGPIETIVCDGGSKDGTSDVVAQFGDIVSKFFSSPDRGPADALNRGIVAASGAVLGYINADDLLKPRAVREAVSVLVSEYGPALVFRDIEYIDEAGKPAIGYGGKLKTYCPGPYEQAAHRLGCMVVAQQGSFWNRQAQELVGAFDPDIQTAFDGHWYARASVKGVKMIYKLGIAASFRVHAAAISSHPKFMAAWKKDGKTVNDVWYASGIHSPHGINATWIRTKRIFLRALRHGHIFLTGK